MVRQAYLYKENECSVQTNTKDSYKVFERILGKIHRVLKTGILEDELNNTHSVKHLLIFAFISPMSGMPCGDADRIHCPKTLKSHC
uniref:Uncharacterized protein n=1 Tax=Romanomermis culicivorax TaxID=13658 RepID=A0A915J9F1_ROMCU